jgi:hypothetical protein
MVMTKELMLMITYPKKVPRAHGRQLYKWFKGEDGGEEVVAVRQHRRKERRPENEQIHKLIS